MKGTRGMSQGGQGGHMTDDEKTAIEIAAKLKGHLKCGYCLEYFPKDKVATYVMTGEDSGNEIYCCNKCFLRNGNPNEWPKIFPKRNP